MGCIKSLKAILFLFGFIPFLVSGQNYPRFELYQLKQGTDSGQFIVTGLDSNLAFNNILRFRSADSTLLIGTDTVMIKSDIASSVLGVIDAGLGIEVNEVDGQIFIESLSIEDSIYNGTVSLISKGTPLYAVGVQGNYWSVAPADASDTSKMPVVVIAGEDIAAGATGLGLIKGHIKQVNTTGLADGAEVYVDVGGGYTSTKPTAEGVIIQRLGTVIKGNSENGSGIINLGDEAYWNDFTSLTKLRDTLVVFRDSITNQIVDSLINYVDRTELGDSLALYPNRTELADTALAIRNDIPLIINDSLTARNFLTENQTITLSGDVTGSGTTDIAATVVDDSHNHIIGNVDNLQTSLDAKQDNLSGTGIVKSTSGTISYITDNSSKWDDAWDDRIIAMTITGDTTKTVSLNRSNGEFLTADFTDLTANFSGTGLVKSTAGTISYITDNSTNWNSAYNDRITSASFSGTTTKTLTLNQQDGGTVTASFTDDTGGGVTATNGGNNRLATFSGTSSIDGDNGFWINNFYELVDNLSDGTAPSSVGYQLKLNHRAFIDSIETNYLDLNSNLTLANNLTVQGSSTFEGTVGDSYFYPSGALGVQTTPSGNLSLTTRYGATFNTDNNFNYGDVTMNGYLINNLFNLDSSEDAIAIGGSTPNSNFDLKTYRGVYINESQSGGIYDGLLVSGSSAVNLLNVKANLNKVGINKLTPDYTLDVDGDINFTGDLYDNGVAVTFGGGADTSYYTLNGSLDYTLNTETSYIYIPSNYVGCTLVESTYGTMALSGNPFTGSIESNIGSASGATFTANTTLFNDSYSSETNIVFVSNSHSYTINSSNRLIQIKKSQTTGLVTSVHFTFNIRCID